jgi:hypothetical protein
LIRLGLDGRIEHVVESLATFSDAGLLAELGVLEAELARVQFRQLQVLAELQSRNVPGQLGLRGLADLIAGQVRCTRVEARRRARAVERFGVRRALTGEALEPVYPAVDWRTSRRSRAWTVRGGQLAGRPRPAHQTLDRGAVPPGFSTNTSPCSAVIAVRSAAQAVRRSGSGWSLRQLTSLPTVGLASG